ncbi:hypothetical protein ACFFU1_12575 [Algibacter miyuki]|uniref:HMA domain-containing protein n=1 Tax=Algibacter miyuki TaxID=1306933 RepID=A0ABV5H1G7_9FLAO|nr:hypothetical protein [Algibacter miyuki]MDN3666351.1 hypothetical protein [Algibacter miyuki]
MLSQQEFTVPNQEIVLEFNQENVSSQETLSAVAQVKQQLQDLGAHNIQVKQTAKGTLKITYYSDADVASIKKTFSKSTKDVLNSTPFKDNNKSAEFPSEGNMAYNLDVYEIESSKTASLGLNGACVLNTDSKSDRFFDRNMLFSIEPGKVSEECNSIKTAYKVRRNVSISTQNNLHNIPEVRAGPTC